MMTSLPPPPSMVSAPEPPVMVLLPDEPTSEIAVVVPLAFMFVKFFTVTPLDTCDEVLARFVFTPTAR